MDATLAGRYRIVREIGAGGIGRVFQAVDLRSGQPVAVKVVIVGGQNDRRLLEWFQREGAQLTGLMHPNIVRVYDVQLEEHMGCIIMELLEGRSLAQLLGDPEGTRQFPLPRVKHLMQQVADALAYAHARGIIHRDVKPDNIVVLADDRVKVTDFGIARILVQGSTLNTMQGTALGSVLFMSPEQIEDSRVDGRTDIYSFGAVMYQLVTGQPPFEGGDPLTIAFRHVHKQPERPGAIKAGIPPAWDEFILKALAKNPAARFQTMPAVAVALAGLPTGLPPPPRPMVSVPRRRFQTTEKLPTDDAQDLVVQRAVQEARRYLEQGRNQEAAGDMNGALASYRSGLVIAPAGQTRQDLEAASLWAQARLRALTPPPQPGPTPPPPSRPGISRQRLILAAAAVVLIIAIAAIALVVLAHRSSAAPPQIAALAATAPLLPAPR
ncbi:MAG: serine/threonine protein kinase [Chloroflexi bacterium]|nr:serine/threonine protein kinase [Chloroflexota bacterium]